MSTRLIRIPEVVRATGLPKSTVYAFARRGLFPQPVKLSERVSAWRSDELDQWVEARTKASRSEGAAA
jgi:prophage regulatory protein